MNAPKRLKQRPAALFAALVLLFGSAAHGGALFGFNAGSWGYPGKSHTIYGLRLNLGASERRAVYGFDAGTTSQTRGTFGGVQFNLFENAVLGDVYGVQLSLLTNNAGMSTGHFKREEPRTAPGELPTLYGGQTALLGNTALFVNGVQLTLGVNSAAALNGIQCAAVKNAALYARGIQFGIFNEAQVLQGLQIGLFNLTHNSLTGIQIGAVNVVNWQNKAEAASAFRILPLINIGW